MGKTLVKYILIFSYESGIIVTRFYCTMVSMNSVNPENCCAVCLKPFEMESKKRVFVKKLKCGHVFHGSCIDKWLARAQNCPCCRESIIKKVPSSCGIEDLLSPNAGDDNW
jgi:hypothetical protein